MSVGKWVRARGHGLAALGLSLAALLGGCEGTYRAFGSASESLDPMASDEDGGLVGGDGGGSMPGAALVVLGEACVTDAECASGFCVEGLCCDARCGEVCATCVAVGSEGTCSPASSDLDCESLACPGATECRGRDQSGVALNCEGIGECRSNLDCAPIDQAEGTPCQDGTGTCNGAGACVVPGKALLGESCVEDSDCAEGNCVVGAEGASICCDSACDGVCEQCSAEGRCDSAPAHDMRCEAVTCPTDNPCLDFVEGMTEDLCRGLGQCKTARDCPSTALRPTASCECDADNDCRLARGAACTTGAECGSGICQASSGGQLVCCAEACGGGLSCAADGSRCVECEGADVSCEGNVAISCRDGRRVSETCANGCTAGVGCNTEAPVGFSCDSASCVADAVCQNDVTGALRCCARDCAAEGKQCAANGSCICPPGQTEGAGASCLLQQGDPCGSGVAQCGAGLTCVDGVCCDDACDGACESCNQQTSRGSCALNVQDDGQCAADEQCVARDDCRGAQRAACTTGGDCVSGNCEPQLGVSGNVCCAAPCNGQRGFCSRDGSRCVECESNADCPNGCDTAQGTCRPLLGLGQICTNANGSQCGSGACVQDATDARLRRCCANCAPGQLCTASGQCRNPPAGAGVDCQVDGDCASNLFCRDGVCCTSRCDGPCARCAAGTGTCNLTPASDPQFCGAVSCAQQSNACQTVTPPQAGLCSRLGQCVSGTDCSVSRAPAGTVCNGTGRCDGLGNCVADTSAPSVGGGAISASGTGFDARTLSWTTANDGTTGTPTADLRYYVYHSFSNDLTTLQQTLAATRLAELRGATSTLIVLPRTSGGARVAQHFFNVVVEDLAGNTAVYSRTQVTLSEPTVCTEGTQCLQGACTVFFQDGDGDRFGNQNVTTGRCGSVAPSGFIPARADGRFDCCDLDNRAFPGARPGSAGIGLTTPSLCSSGSNEDFDYDCDGTETSGSAGQNQLQSCSTRSVADCASGGGWAGVTQVPECGDTAGFGGCAVTSAAPAFCGTGNGGSVTRACR